MNKNEVKEAINELDASQLVEFNDNCSSTVVFNANPGSGYSGSVGSLIDAVDALSNPDFFWLENNPGSARVGGVRNSRPC